MGVEAKGEKRVHSAAGCAIMVQGAGMYEH